MKLKEKLTLNQNNKSNIKNSASTLILKIIGLLLSYLVIFFITRNFGAVVYGRYSIIITIGQLVAVIFTLGFPSILVKFLNDKKYYDNELKIDFFKKISITTFILGILITSITFLLSEFIAVKLLGDITYKKHIQIIAFFFIPLMFHELFLGYYRGLRNFFKHNLFVFILPPILFFFWYFFLQKIIDLDYKIILAYGFAITTILCLEFFFFIRTKQNKPFEKINILFIVKQSFPMMYSSLMLYLLGWTDIFMLEAMRTTQEVGVYNASFKIASIGFVFITAVNVIISPKIATYYNNSDFKNLHKTVVFFTRLISYLTIPVFIIVLLFGNYILSLFGVEFTEGKMALNIIIIGVLISALSGNVDQILNMTGNQKVLSKIVLIGFLLNILLNLFLIPKYGITGAAFASLATNTFINLACIYQIKKKLGFYTFM